MKVFLYISDVSFDGSLAFLRDLKARGQEAFVFSMALQKESNCKKIIDLGFSLIEKENPYAKLSEETESSVLVTSFEKMLPLNFKEEIYCSGFSSYDLENITIPVNNIYQRVNIANLIEKNVIEKLGNLLSIGYIYAPQDFWILMNGLYKKWLTEFYVSSSPVVHDLLFNFCVAFSNKNVFIGM